MMLRKPAAATTPTTPKQSTNATSTPGDTDKSKNSLRFGFNTDADGKHVWILLVIATVSSVALLMAPPQDAQAYLKTLQTPAKIDIPECERSPWKPNEVLVGNCPGIKPAKLSAKDAPIISSASECAQACCDLDTCITWQFRRDKGCLHGSDVRIGQEKDGPAGYCSAHPPLRWQGQYLTKGRKEKECSVDTWQPNEHTGQCFGLGEARKGNFESAKDCMEACCADAVCQAWQFQETLGCFYNKGMHACQPTDDPIVFESFEGRRKLQSSRTYTDKHGKPT